MNLMELLFFRQWRFHKFYKDRRHVIVSDSIRKEMLNIPYCLFNKLYEHDIAQEATFSEALKTVWYKSDSFKAGVDSDFFPFTANLRLLTCNLLIRCKFSKCLNGIKEMFSAYVVGDDQSPDYIIDCDWKNCRTELFVFRPSEHMPPMKGLRVHVFGSIANNDWSYTQAPLPPLPVGPLKNQFVGLHSGVVKSPSGKGLLIVGLSGSGKTSSCIELTAKYRCSLLSDEFAFIHKRTALVESFAIPLGIAIPGSAKKYYPAESLVTNICHDPVLITHVVFLERCSEAKLSFEKIDAYTSLKYFLSHHQDFECNVDEAIVTLMTLAKKISAVRFKYSKYEELMEGCKKFLDFCEISGN
jgi:hypothetical protein